MATPSFGNSDFLLGYCRSCAKEVLTHLDLTPADEEVLRCLHCDEIIGDRVRVVSNDELEGAGYTLLEARGCGNGGGCSAGTCGTRVHSSQSQTNHATDHQVRMAENAPNSSKF